MSYSSSSPSQPISLIPPHGGYQKLASYQMAQIIYDGTVAFCRKYKSYLTYKTYEQMVGAARSGKQNIVEGSLASGTSKKTELKLVGIARASLGELLEDYQDLSRERRVTLWEKQDPRALSLRRLATRKNRSYKTYKTYIESTSLETSLNTLVCLIHQTSYLLDQQLKSLELAFLEHGGFTERLYTARQNYRNKSYKSY